jgi:hypothetical protein
VEVTGRLCGAIGILLVMSAALTAAEFWHDKDFTTWTNNEVERMLTDSPWSRPVRVHTPDLTLATRVGGLSGGIVGTGGGFFRGGVGYGGGGVGGDAAGNLGGGSFMAPPRSTKLVVRWMSAFPLKQAYARSRRSEDDPRQGEPVTFPVPDEAVYRVAVIRIPPALTSSLGSVGELLAATTLRPKNGAAIGATDLQLAYEGDRLSFAFEFPRRPIALADHTVEFTMTLGSVEVSATYVLREMVVAGALAL